MECDWKNTERLLECCGLIDTHSSAPPTWKESHCFFGRGLRSFLFPDKEIYRGRDSYCWGCEWVFVHVCGQPTFIADIKNFVYRICFIRCAIICLH